MEILILSLVILFFVIATLIVLFKILKKMGDNDFIFSNYEQNKIKYVKRGEKVIDAFMAVESKQLNPNWYVTDARQGHESTSAQNAWCPFRFIGLYGPMIPFITSIHEYPFVWNSAIKETDKQKLANDIARENEEGKKQRGEIGHPLRFKIRYHRTEIVNSLYYIYVYPILAMDVELNDGSKVDILIWVTATIDHVLRPVFDLNGEWFTQIESAVIGQISNWAKGFDYDLFEDANKKELEEQVKIFLSSMKEDTGVIFERVHYAEYDLSFDPDGLIEAAQQKKRIAEAGAEALKIGADAQAYKITTEGEAEAKILQKKFEATGSSPEVEMIKALPPGLQVLGGNPLVNIQPKTSSKTAEPPEKEN